MLTTHSRIALILSASTSFFRHICPPTSTLCLLIHPNPKSATRSRRTAGHQVRSISKFHSFCPIPSHRSSLYFRMLSDSYLVTASTRDWREKQAAEIKARDEASVARRQETIAKAERSIDEFYEEYSGKKERNIRDNKYVFKFYSSSFSSPTNTSSFLNTHLSFTGTKKPRT